MQKSRRTFSEAKQISITDYLTRLGIEQVKVYGNDWWYFSPFRNERTPSFKVNTKLNLWYDHGIGEGGTILELGTRLNQCTVAEFLDMLSTGNYNAVSFHNQSSQPEQAVSKLEIISDRDLVDPSLLYYLRSRGIEPAIAKPSCKEVDFKIGSSHYKAIGFPNRAGGYELRNSWFKGSSSPKDISLIGDQPGKIAVFEGFMDFLSLLQLNTRKEKPLAQHSSFLVLNSLRFVSRSLPILQQPQQVTLYLDNDLAATEAKNNFKTNGLRFEDASRIYKGHKDLNEYLVATTKVKHNLDQHRTRSRRPKM